MINHNCALCWFFKTDSSFSWVIILQVHFVSFSEKSHLSFFKSFSRFGFPSDPKEAFIILQVMFSVKFWHFLSLSFCKSSLFFPVSVYHFPGSFCQNFHQPHVQKIQTQVFYACFVAMPNVFQLFSIVLCLLRGNAKRFKSILYFLHLFRGNAEHFLLFTTALHFVSRQCQTFFNCFLMLYHGIYHFPSSDSQLKNRK